MNHTADNNRAIIEFKYIVGEEMLEEVRTLFLQYVQSLKIDLTFQNFQTEFKELPGKYVWPHGSLILAFVNGKAAGCVALRKLSQDICEMKRLYVNDEYRGLGLGIKLINMIIEEALKLNYNYMRLDTLETMKKAQSLYLSLGFYDIEPYVYNPIKGTRFMELKLRD